MERDIQPSCHHECETCTIDRDEPWECEVCLYQHGEAPPKGLACLRCKQVNSIFEKLKQEREQEPASLVDRLHRLVGCEYLSSLKEPPWRAPLLKVIDGLDLGSYSLAEWSSALSYCLGERVQFASLEELQTYLAQQSAQT